MLQRFPRVSSLIAKKIIYFRFRSWLFFINIGDCAVNGDNEQTNKSCSLSLAQRSGERLWKIRIRILQTQRLQKSFCTRLHLLPHFSRAQQQFRFPFPRFFFRLISTKISVHFICLQICHLNSSIVVSSPRCAHLCYQLNDWNDDIVVYQKEMCLWRDRSIDCSSPTPSSILSRASTAKRLVVWPKMYQLIIVKTPSRRLAKLLS
jgi:hypothetical protein